MVGALRRDIEQASGLPQEERVWLVSGIEKFIWEMHSLMQKTEHEPELFRLWRNHTERRKALVAGGFSAEWAHHAFCESYLQALVSKDHKYVKEVHTLLCGLRGSLNLA